MISNELDGRAPTFLEKLYGKPQVLNTHPHNQPTFPEIQKALSESSYNPVLKAALHIMNSDLYSAHIIVRSMQGEPWAGWLHGILHRYEGDYCNNKCWYHDVQLSKFHEFWKTKRDSYNYIDEVALKEGLTLEKILDTTKKLSETKKEQVECYSEKELRALNPRSKDELAKIGSQELRFFVEALSAEVGWGYYDLEKLRTVSKEQVEQFDEVIRDF